MNTYVLSLAPEHLTSFALEAFLTQADALNQRHRTTYTASFPKGPSRWLSHDTCTPRPIALTREGDVDGGLSWLVGATIDFSFIRALCAPHSGARGGPCYDPASLVVLEVAATVDHSVDYAHFCGDLHHTDTGRRSRELAGLHAHVPGQDDCCHFRARVGNEALRKTLAVMVGLLHTFGLITGELLSTDGQLEPPYARYKGCAYAREACQQFPGDAADQAELRDPLHRGATRLQVTCRFPEVVATVRDATTTQGNPRDPKITLLEVDTGPHGHPSDVDRRQIATLLGLPEDTVPPVGLHRCHLYQRPQGALLGRCPKIPADLDAKVG